MRMPTPPGVGILRLPNNLLSRTAAISRSKGLGNDDYCHCEPVRRLARQSVTYGALSLPSESIIRPVGRGIVRKRNIAERMDPFPTAMTGFPWAIPGLTTLFDGAILPSENL